MNATHDSRVTMAIAPTSHGFGYVVFDNPDLLIDWGVKDVRKNKLPDSLLKVRVLMHMLQPEVLVVEDAHHSSSRRSKRVRELVDKIADLAKDKGIVVARCSRQDVLTIFGRVGAQSKDDIAGAVAKVLPELAPRLPRRRRIWESEHYSMAIFEAAALGLTHFACSEERARPRRRA
jgi:ribosomal protein L17